MFLQSHPIYTYIVCIGPTPYLHCLSVAVLATLSVFTSTARKQCLQMHKNLIQMLATAKGCPDEEEWLHGYGL